MPIGLNSIFVHSQEMPKLCFVVLGKEQDDNLGDLLMHLNTVVTLKLYSVYVEFLVVHVNLR